MAPQRAVTGASIRATMESLTRPRRPATAGPSGAFPRRRQGSRAGLRGHRRAGRRDGARLRDAPWPARYHHDVLVDGGRRALADARGRVRDRAGRSAPAAARRHAGDGAARRRAVAAGAAAPGPSSWKPADGRCPSHTTSVAIRSTIRPRAPQDLPHRPLGPPVSGGNTEPPHMVGVRCLVKHPAGGR